MEPGASQRGASLITPASSFEIEVLPPLALFESARHVKYCLPAWRTTRMTVCFWTDLGGRRVVGCCRRARVVKCAVFGAAADSAMCGRPWGRYEYWRQSKRAEVHLRLGKDRPTPRVH